VGGAHTDRWIFGYASLVWRPAFAFEERAPAFVRGWDGGEVDPLDEDAVRRAALELKEAGCEAVAVCFLWSVVNPSHEQQFAEFLDGLQCHGGAIDERT